MGTITAIEQFKQTIDAEGAKIAAVLPRQCDAARFLRMVVGAVAANPKLLDCDRTSLFLAVTSAAQLGLELDPNLGHAYLIPRKGRACLQLGYKGLAALAYRSDKVLSFSAGLVRAGDDFEFERGTNAHLRHVMKAKPDNKTDAAEATHAWAMCRLAGGVTEFEVLDISEVNAIRKRSQGDAAGFSPWQSDFAAMATKTALRRLCKLLPLSPDCMRAITIDEAVERGEPEDAKGAADAFQKAVVVPRKELNAPTVDDESLDFDEALIPSGSEEK